MLSIKKQMKQLLIQNYPCFIGENAKENWDILTKAYLNKNPNYLFFHLSSFPSCYVILHSEEKVENNVIEECARLCLDHTKFRNMKGIYVDYTFISNTRKGDIVGEVEYISGRKVKKIRMK